jgi:hypothetical protein
MSVPDDLSLCKRIEVLGHEQHNRGLVNEHVKTRMASHVEHHPRHFDATSTTMAINVNLASRVVRHVWPSLPRLRDPPGDNRSSDGDMR